MLNLPIPRRLLVCLAAVTLPLLFLGQGGFVTVGQSAYAPPKEEDDPTPPKRQLPKEEDDNTPPKRKLPDEADDNPPPKTKPPDQEKPKPPPVRLTSLAEEARLAKDPAEKQLYEELAIPYDEVKLDSGRKRVKPVRHVLGSGSHAKGKVELYVYGKDLKGEPEKKQVNAADVKEFVSYEQRAIRLVNERLLDEEANPLKGATDDDKADERLKRLGVAEKILERVAYWHDHIGMRVLRDKADDHWKRVEQDLHDQLAQAQIKRLDLLAHGKDLDAAMQRGLQLVQAYPDREDLQYKVLAVQLQKAQQSQSTQEYREVRLRLEDLDKQFHGATPEKAPPERARVEQALKERAQALFDQARDLKENKNDKDKAGDVIEQAMAVYPKLPGLEEYFSTLFKDHASLNIGEAIVPEPGRLWPTRVATDADRQGEELVFEGLFKPVKRTDDPAVGNTYELGLVADWPEMIPLGRRCRLDAEARWSDGKPVTVDDLRDSWRRLREAGYLDMVAAPSSTTRGVASLTLQQGALNPLGFFTFKLTPAGLNLSDVVVQKKPIGSGPFMYKEKTGEGDVVFVTNPHYHERPGREGLPRIREIRFVPSTNPVKDFGTHKIDMYVNLPTSEVAGVEAAGIKVETLRNRRIYMLAVNQSGRVAELQDVNVRKAIANAIDRKQILDTAFRSGWRGTGTPHRPLNGPYPPGSWAYNPDVPEFRVGNARPAIGQAKALNRKQFELIYPAGDKGVEQACQMIAQQVKNNTGLELSLKAMSPQDVQDKVLGMDYELAYYYWDYLTDDYVLWPLFEPLPEPGDTPSYPGQGKRNFLQFKPQGSVSVWETLNDARNVRDFQAKGSGMADTSKIRKVTQQVHEMVNDQLPFIPLWQIDTHVAYDGSHLHPNDNKDMDPLLIFNEVEHWRMDKPR
jgi:ABC-type transport system substrate-binding protein